MGGVEFIGFSKLSLSRLISTVIFLFQLQRHEPDNRSFTVFICIYLFHVDTIIQTKVVSIY